MRVVSALLRDEKKSATKQIDERTKKHLITLRIPHPVRSIERATDFISELELNARVSDYQTYV